MAHINLTDDQHNATYKVVSGLSLEINASRLGENDSTYDLFKLPAGIYITRSFLHITTAFNGTAPHIDIGFAGAATGNNADKLVDNRSLTASGIFVSNVTTSIATQTSATTNVDDLSDDTAGTEPYLYLNLDRTVQAVIGFGTTKPTTGRLLYVMEFIDPNSHMGYFLNTSPTPSTS